jgi:hypothetical protein
MANERAVTLGGPGQPSFGGSGGGGSVEFTNRATDPPRRELLNGAIGATCTDRNGQYGEPYDVMKRHTDQLNALGYRGPEGRLLEPFDNAIIEIALKQARNVGAPHIRDNWLDTAGYGAIGWEAAVIGGANKSAHTHTYDVSEDEHHHRPVVTPEAVPDTRGWRD